jgi:hypothetical protein
MLDREKAAVHREETGGTAAGIGGMVTIVDPCTEKKRPRTPQRVKDGTVVIPVRPMRALPLLFAGGSVGIE